MRKVFYFGLVPSMAMTDSAYMIANDFGGIAMLCGCGLPTTRRVPA